MKKDNKMTDWVYVFMGVFLIFSGLAILIDGLNGDRVYVLKINGGTVNFNDSKVSANIESVGNWNEKNPIHIQQKND